MVVHDDAVVDNCGIGRADQVDAVKTRCRPQNVVGLPLAGGTAGVDQRRIFAVYGSRNTVGVGRIFIAVQDLYFVASHEKDAAVAPPLTISLDFGWAGKLQVSTYVAKVGIGLNIARARHDFHIAIFNFPARIATANAAPTREVTAVKEHDGVSRCLTNGICRNYDARCRSLGVVHAVGRVADEGYRRIPIFPSSLLLSCERFIALKSKQKKLRRECCAHASGIDKNPVVAGVAGQGIPHGTRAVDRCL